MSAVECYNAAMLADWLGPASLDEFCARSLRRAPAAQPATALAARELLSWEVLDRVLRTADDVLVVSRGQRLPVPTPRSLAELRDYFSAGIGLCVRHGERHDPGLAGVAAAFGELGQAQVQLFVTPGGTHGFGWHYDDEDVFIAQTAGVKDYYFRANTVAAGEPAHPEMFARFSAETSALCTATLIAGDFLYLPARWWHMAVCHADALSISVGVTLDASFEGRAAR
jgi:50S ribosomal protein L16 3-hydroxylase